MKDYLSRWEYLKDRSPWHFDTNAQPTEDWQILGRFLGSWEKELNDLVQSAGGGTPLNFFNKMVYDTPYTAALDTADVKKMGLGKDYVFLQRIMPPYLNPIDCPIIFKMVDWFELEAPLAKIHIQQPGQVFPLHIDDLTTHRGNRTSNLEMDEHPEHWARFEVQLKDWCWGHVWGIGNTYWKQWKAGDIMYHPWWIHPHGTANFGMEPRINLQVTGKVTSGTLEKLKSSFKSIEL